MTRSIPDISAIGGFNYSWDFNANDFAEWAEEEMGVPADKSAFVRYLEDGYVTFTLEYVDHETYHSTGDYADLDYDGVCDEYGKSVADEMVQFLATSGKSEGFIDKMEIVEDEDEVDLSNPDEVNRIALKYMPHGDYSKGVRGFILSNGEVVYTENEHNECTIVPGVRGTFHFIEMGNIRVLPQSIDIAKAPTPEQRRTLANVISSYADDRLYVDLIGDMGEHSVTYTYPNWRIVLNEIDRFFRDGIKPMDRVFSESRVRRIVAEAVMGVLNEAFDGIVEWHI